MPRPEATSLIDRVDEQDRPIGVIRRGDVFDVRANFRTVHIFVFNRDGHLLLQQLGRTRERHPLKWGSSVAGYLHTGESYEEAAIRRTQEELGLCAPLAAFGRTDMQDKGCLKFVALFTTEADHPVVRESAHIESIDFRSLESIDHDVLKDPRQFTATFREVFRYYRNSQ